VFGSQGHYTRLPYTRSNLTSAPSAGLWYSQSYSISFSTPSSCEDFLGESQKSKRLNYPFWHATSTHNPITGIIQNADPTARLTAGQP
jgi:hypothetical protein